jgi:hypothetical protein
MPPSETQLGAFGLPFVQSLLLSQVTTGRDPTSIFQSAFGVSGFVDMKEQVFFLRNRDGRNAGRT